MTSATELNRQKNTCQSKPAGGGKWSLSASRHVIDVMIRHISRAIQATNTRTRTHKKRLFNNFPTAPKEAQHEETVPPCGRKTQETREGDGGSTSRLTPLHRSLRKWRECELREAPDRKLRLERKRRHVPEVKIKQCCDDGTAKPEKKTQKVKHAVLRVPFI